MAQTVSTPTKKRRIEIPDRDIDTGLQDRIDRWLVGGCLLIGTFVLAPIGLLLVWRGFALHREARRNGAVLRPGIITVLAIICIVDAAINYLMWCIDFFPAHDTVLGQSLMTGFGRLWDGAYYLGYNTTALGGTAIPTEKALEFAGCLILYPMRLVAAWGFMRMKKWGFQYLVVNTWMYVFFWVTYIAAFSIEFQWRFPFTAGGVALLWGLYIWFIYPFFMIPYLATVNRDLWKD